MFRRKEETYNFTDFMKKQHDIKLPKDLKTYGLVTVSPLAMFDPVVLCVAGGILGFVVLEKQLLGGSLFHIGEWIGKFLGLICPIVLFGAVLYFLMTNPFILGVL